MEKRWLRLLVCLVSSITVLMALTHHFTMGDAEAGSDKELVIQTWGGRVLEAQKHAFFDPFTEDTRIKIVPVEAGGDMWGKPAAQVRSGNIEWDLVSGDFYPAAEAAGKKGLLEEIDYNIVTNTKDLIPGSVKRWGLGQELCSYILAYNVKKFPGENRPRSWADFFDVKKFPGPRTFSNWGAPEFNLWAALLADGVPPDKLVPIDFDRAYKKLDRIKPHVKVWYTSGDQLMQLLIDEEVVLALATDGRAKIAKELGAPIDFVWDQGMFEICYWNVLKNAPHKEAAMRFLTYVPRPDLQAIWTNYVGYSCSNPKSVRYLHPKVQKDQAISPENFKKQVDVLTEKNSAWLTEHREEINERWNAWLAE